MLRCKTDGCLQEVRKHTVSDGSASIINFCCFKSCKVGSHFRSVIAGKSKERKYLEGELHRDPAIYNCFNREVRELDQVGKMIPRLKVSGMMMIDPNFLMRIAMSVGLEGA